MSERDYEIEIQTISESAYVDTGREHYLVVSHFKKDWKTYVFLHVLKPDTWILRREILGRFEPLAAVTGTVLAGRHELNWDPVSDLKRKLEQSERAYYRLLNEKMKPKREGRCRHAKRR